MIGTSLKHHWLAQGIEINPGVSKEKLTAFESRYRVSLPADLRDYFLTVDGMADGFTDNALIRFWSLSEVKPIPEEAPSFSDPSYVEDAESLFVFADYSIWCHAYAIRLSLTGDSNPIFVIGDETPLRMFGSFSELVSTYLTNADLLVSNIRESPEDKE